jgi:hypothetical protein
MKGKKRNVKRNLKNKRKIKMFKRNYIDILSGLYIAFWSTLYVTLNDIITKKTTFCQGYSLMLVLGSVVLILLYLYHKKLDKKVDIKSFDKSLINNTKIIFIVLILTEITNSFMN